jgi:hypothetical protein
MHEKLSTRRLENQQNVHNKPCHRHDIPLGSRVRKIAEKKHKFSVFITIFPSPGEFFWQFSQQLLLHILRLPPSHGLINFDVVGAAQEEVEGIHCVCQVNKCMQHITEELAKKTRGELQAIVHHRTMDGRKKVFFSPP